MSQKILIAYFSATGTVKEMAGKLARVVRADSFEIEAAEPYTRADLNWQDQASRVSVEMADGMSRPAVKSVPDLSAYDIIFLGYPIWYGVAPHVVNTFLEACDLTGKTVVPFASCSGSGIGDTAKYLAPSAKGAKVRMGMRFANNQALKDFRTWVDMLKIVDEENLM